MATIRMSEEEAIRRGIIEPKEKIRYVRIPVNVPGPIRKPSLFRYVLVFVIGFLVGFWMALVSMG